MLEDGKWPASRSVLATLRAGSHGVPSQKSQSPSHVSKSQYGGKVETFEPQEIIKLSSIIIEDRCWLIFAGLVLRVGSSFLLDPTLNTGPKAHLQKVLRCRHPYHTSCWLWCNSKCLYGAFRTFKQSSSLWRIPQQGSSSKPFQENKGCFLK